MKLIEVFGITHKTENSLVWMCASFGKHESSTETQHSAQTTNPNKEVMFHAAQT